MVDAADMLAIAVSLFEAPPPAAEYASRVIDRIASGVACGDFGNDDPIAFRQLLCAELEARGGLVEIDGETCNALAEDIGDA